jgi:ketosteroid isomerase-like protein
MNNIQTEITAINASFDQAFNAKKAADIAQLYEANATVMPAPAGAPVIGVKAIQDFFAGLIEAGVIDHKLTLTEAVTDGNLAYQRGNWSGAMIDAEGTRQSFGGNVHLVYRKQVDGTWKAVTHIWN